MAVGLVHSDNKLLSRYKDSLQQIIGQHINKVKSKVNLF